jgi:glycerol-3-phosphate dehydrogenase
MTGNSRDAQLGTLRSPVDLVVIGGGITGAGVALEAAARGLRVALLEQADFAGGTSSRSTKLVHGGIRYLAQGHIGLVRESLRQRGELLRAAPDLVRPLPFVIPLYRGLHRPLGLRVPGMFRPLTPVGVKAGLQLYDWLAGAPSLRHQTLSTAEATIRVPDLRTDGLQTAFLYYDAQTDDVRLTHAVLATARGLGAVTLNYGRVDGFLRDGRRIAGVMFEDRLTGGVGEVRAHRVVNAAGVWAERVAAMDAPPEFRITPGKGIHLVLRPGGVSLNSALVIPETDDGRLAFLVPWIGGRIVLGTTDDGYDGPLEGPTAQPDEVAYLLDHANRYLRHPLTLADVVGVFAGLRPLIASRQGPSAVLSREHAIVESPGGLVSIIGGKLTSFRQMAREVVDRLAPGTGYQISAKPVPGTADGMLDGADGLAEASSRLAVSGLGGHQQQYLLTSYGGRAQAILEIGRDDPEMLRALVDDLPICAAEVVYACREEMAVALADVMLLRTRLSVLRADGGQSAVDRVEAIMASEFGWDDAERRRQRDRWEFAVSQERAALQQ